MPITVTANLLNTNTALLDCAVVDTTSPAVTPVGQQTRWDVRAVNMARTHTYAFYPTAEVLSITWNYNQPDEAEVAISIDDPGLTELDPDAGTTREIALYRNGSLIFVGKPWTRRADATSRRMILSCKDPTAYLQHRYIGRANRKNHLNNGSFETGAMAPWAEYDPDSSLTPTVGTTHHVDGTHALKLVGSVANEGSFVSQSFVVASSVSRRHLFLVAWCYIENWIGSALFDAGILLVREGVSGPNAYSVQHIDASTNRDAWVRLETFVRIPANHIETVTARLYGIHGTIWWDAVRLNSDEHLGWGPNHDQADVIHDVIQYAQSKGKFGYLSPEKSDLHIRPVITTTGVGVQSGLRYDLADHQKVFVGGPQGSGVLDHYLNAGDGVDWRFEPNGRILRSHYPSAGHDRTDVTFTFRHIAGAPERDAQWGIVGWNYGDSIEQAANQVVELGGWGGTQYPGDPTREEGGYSNAGSLGGLTLEQVETAPQGMPISQLNGRATARGKRLENTIATPQLILAEPRDKVTGAVIYPLIGVLLPGDKINVDVIDGELRMQGDWRAVQVVYEPASETLTVTPNPVVV